MIPLKRHLATLIGLFILAGSCQAGPPLAEESPLLTIVAVSAIEAGEALSVGVLATGGTQAIKVDMALFNGTQGLTKRLEPNTEGRAIWDIPAGAITQAGQSLIIARAGQREARHTIAVRAGLTDQIDFFSTSNRLPAYGDGLAVLVGFLTDPWGSPARSEAVRLRIRFPAFAPVDNRLAANHGLVWAQLASQGQPGRVRLWLEADSLSQALEIWQVAGPPYRLVLTVSPPCVADDGRDIFSLVVLATDAHGYPVENGTLIRFAGSMGQGQALTIQGQASLRLAAPTVPDRYVFSAFSGQARSEGVSVTVAAGGCTE